MDDHDRGLSDLLDKAEYRRRFKRLADEYIKPENRIGASRYWWDNWVPLLGPTLAAIVVRLRDYATVNENARELHNGWREVWPTQGELAEKVGVSKNTLHRQLQHPAARYFIKRIPRYQYDAEKRKKVRIADAYEILMDDPLTPEDEKDLTWRVARELIAESQIRPKHQIGDQVPKTGPKHQNGDALTLISTSIRKPTNVKKTATVEKLHRVEATANQLTEELEDPASWEFFLKVAWRCPEQMILTALAETKDAHLSGRIKKSRGACFTDLIKRKAGEVGIGL